MDIHRAGSRPSGKGPADWFTGTVRIDPLFPVDAPARAAGNAVTFEPGARTAWHTHPLGQILIVTAGCGRVQREGGPIEEIRPGDVVRFAPGEKHWHGAAPLTAPVSRMAHPANPGKETLFDAVACCSVTATVCAWRRLGVEEAMMLPRRAGW